MTRAILVGLMCFVTLPGCPSGPILRSGDIIGANGDPVVEYRDVEGFPIPVDGVPKAGVVVVPHYHEVTARMLRAKLTELGFVFESVESTPTRTTFHVVKGDTRYTASISSTMDEHSELSIMSAPATVTNP